MRSSLLVRLLAASATRGPIQWAANWSLRVTSAQMNELFEGTPVRLVDVLPWDARPPERWSGAADFSGRHIVGADLASGEDATIVADCTTVPEKRQQLVRAQGWFTGPTCRADFSQLDDLPCARSDGRRQ